MLSPQDEVQTLTHSLPAWMPQAIFWVLVVGALAAAAAAAGAWILVARQRALLRQLKELDRVAEIEAEVKKLVADRDDLDLRRLEHVLVELRDDQRRLEDVLLRHAEAATAASLRGEPSTAVALPTGGGAVGERAINRLLALGFERVQLVTRADKLAEIGAQGGEVLVEARREGVLHKGRVLVRGGAIADVEMHPAYSIFP